MELSLTRSEAVRVQNVLCREICVLSDNGALDPKKVTKTDLKHNLNAIKHDRSALEKLTGNADATLEKWKRGRWWKLYLKQKEKDSQQNSAVMWAAKVFLDDINN